MSIEISGSLKDILDIILDTRYGFNIPSLEKFLFGEEPFFLLKMENGQSNGMGVLKEGDKWTLCLPLEA